MNQTLEEWHVRAYGCRPGRFVVRWDSVCAWCGGPMMPGDEGAYLLFEDRERGRAGHFECLRVIWQSETKREPS